MFKSSVLALLLAIQCCVAIKFASLSSCTGTNCLWMGNERKLVDGNVIVDQFIKQLTSTPRDMQTVTRNLRSHIKYIEDVFIHADAVNHEMSMRLGLNERHLHEDASSLGSPVDVVKDSIRGLSEGPVVQSRDDFRRLDVPATLNWCTTNNPLKRSVCSPVKSQNLCGSCWAFAATDVIETAVSMTSGKDAVPLSPQQLITCSTSSRVATYDYCFAGKPGIPTWLEPKVPWKSENQGCNGGMTHIALQDAGINRYSLVTELTWPYSEASGSNTGGATTRANISCDSISAVKTAASITGWSQAISNDACSITSDPVVLLQRALSSGPLSVALNAKGAFKNYGGDVYICPNFTSSNQIDYALLLVGYDTDPVKGLYWILKNSYGTSWGISGFMHLKTDTSLNCGLNVFPIKVVGATNGVANTTVDGGGSLSFAGTSMSAWIYIGIATGVATIVLTIAGVIVARQRMAK